MGGTDETTNRITDQEILLVSVIIFLVQRGKQPDSAIVRFENCDYELVSINDQSAGQLLSFCRRKYGDWWEKRFTEDVVEVLDEMGHPTTSDKTVRLVLKDSASRGVTIERAPMPAENRRARKCAFYAALGGPNDSML